MKKTTKNYYENLKKGDRKMKDFEKALNRIEKETEDILSDFFFENDIDDFTVGHDIVEEIMNAVKAALIFENFNE